MSTQPMHTRFYLSKNGIEKMTNKEFIKNVKNLIENFYNEHEEFSVPKNNFLATTPIHVKVQYVNSSDELDIEALKADKEFGNLFSEAIFIGDDGKVVPLGKDLGWAVTREVEKMSKSKYNVVNPDEICEQYGADSLRLYEMFLGPLEQAKPWNTAGITGVHGFLKKLWRLYHQGKDGVFHVNSSPPSEGLGEELKVLHKTIKKVQEDIENFSFNTSVSTFMIAVNELTALKCNHKAILEPLLIILIALCTAHF